MFRPLQLLLLAIICICCKQEVQKQEEDLFELLETGEIITFSLDSTTSPFINACQIVKENENTYLTFLNDISNSIYWYNLKSRQLYKVQQFLEEGPNGTGDIVGYFYMHPDTVILISRNNHKIRFVNAASEVFGVIDLSSVINEDNGLCFPLAGFGRDIILEDDKLFIMCAHDFVNSSNMSPKNVIVIDIKNNKTEYLLDYPDIYHNRNISAYYLHAYQTFNPSTNKFTYSFPLCEYLIETDHAGYLKSHLAKSNFFSADAWQRKDLVEHNTKISSRDLLRNYMKTPTYKYLIFDSYRNTYYRIAEIPQQELQTKDNYPVKYQSVLILNEQFQKIGEHYLDINSKPSPYFLTNDGIYFHTNPLKESLLTFRKLVLKKKK